MGNGKSILTSGWPAVSVTFLALCQDEGLMYRVEITTNNGIIDLRIFPILQSRECRDIRNWETKPHVLVLELHDGLHRAVIVKQVDRSDHLGAFEIADLERHTSDGVTADQLDDLLRGGVPGVYLDGGQLDVLSEEEREVGNRNKDEEREWHCECEARPLQKKEPRGCCIRGTGHSPGSTHQTPRDQTTC